MELQTYINKQKNVSSFPYPEWTEQDAVQLTWPHLHSDWDFCYEDVVKNFREIARAIVRFERLIIVSENVEKTKKELGDDFPYSKVVFIETSTNDTWARDHSAISIRKCGTTFLYDFVFNGWGKKFAAELDNNISKTLFKNKVFSDTIDFQSVPLVLEGGAVDFDEFGTMLTTTSCMCSKNRNDELSWNELMERLADKFSFSIAWGLSHGELEGDDTDGHIDTLARFCGNHNIAYVKCYDEADSHYEELQAMERQLSEIRDINGEMYNLFPLPLPDPIYDGEDRLPATYANFLVLNGAVLVPIYNQAKDEIALSQLRKLFPDREIIGIDCRTLIRQHGSLHCVTMQYPKGSVR